MICMRKLYWIRNEDSFFIHSEIPSTWKHLREIIIQPYFLLILFSHELESDFISDEDIKRVLFYIQSYRMQEVIFRELYEGFFFHIHWSVESEFNKPIFCLVVKSDYPCIMGLMKVFCHFHIHTNDIQISRKHEFSFKFRQTEIVESEGEETEIFSKSFFERFLISIFSVLSKSFSEILE